MKTAIGVPVLLLTLCVTLQSASAFTYTYGNGTPCRVKVTVHLYDGTDRIGELEANGSYTISSEALLKSWSAEAFTDNEWKQVVSMTCDLLPGNHTFSIYFDETKDVSGQVTRIWNALIK